MVLQGGRSHGFTWQKFNINIKFTSKFNVLKLILSGLHRVEECPNPGKHAGKIRLMEALKILLNHTNKLPELIVNQFNW
jgi:hypothetical protein